MKTNKFWSYLVVATMMIGMVTMTSCEKDDFGLPEVTESEVLDAGLGADVDKSVGAEGTELSYESWIMVRGITRASFENKVSVTLKGQFNNVEATCPINHWDIGEAENAISYEVSDRREEGFVTIVDSVLVYTVRFPEFSFDYRLNYEVACYDDGVTREIMPYYYYSNIVDNGGELVVADSYIDGDYAYARRIYRHSITVDFGGESYELKADITLRRELGSAYDPFILRSQVVSQSLTTAAGGESFLATINVKSTMSTGGDVDQTYTAELPFINERYTGNEITVYGSKDDLVLEKAFLERVSSSFENGGECITLERMSENCILRYNYFTLSIPLIRYEALFDNIVLQERLGAYNFDEESIRVTEMNWKLEEEQGNEKHYFLSLRVQIGIRDVAVEGIYDGWFVFIED